jgi:hypothetical protein
MYYNIMYIYCVYSGPPQYARTPPKINEINHSSYKIPLVKEAGHFKLPLGCPE